MAINASAFLLIGGKSKRFGSPKWKVILNNESVLNRIWSQLESFKYRAVIGKKEPSKVHKSFLTDTLNLDAPINGIYTALSSTRTDWSFIISCDLPLLNSTVLDKLVSFTDTEQLSAIIPFAQNQLQVTCGFYHKQCLPILKSQIKSENYSLHSLINQLTFKKVIFQDSTPFWNMNTEKDYRDIEQYLSNHSK